MNKRNYNQNCALALALDVIGERWSLLIVRELMTGPKRYNELLPGLRGMGTNLLAARLKQLEVDGVVRKRAVTDSAHEYELTEHGWALEPAMLNLVRWGNRYRSRTSTDAVGLPRWDMVAVRAAFRPEESTGVNETYEFEVDGFVFHATVSAQTVDVQAGPAQTPAVRLKADHKTLGRLAAGSLDWEAAITKEKVFLQGRKSALKRLLKMFRL